MFEERINALLANGKLSGAQAEDMRAVLNNLEKVRGVETRKPMPTGLIVGLGGLVLGTVAIAGLAYAYSSTGGAPAPEIVQNVAETMNQPGTTGRGSAILAGAFFFILFFLLPFMILVVAWSFTTWNALAGLDEQASASKAVLQAALQRRRDLLPNLFEAVKELMGFEKDVQTAASGRAGLLDEMARDMSTHETEPKADIPFFAPRIAALVQAYPDVKSVQNMQGVQDELASSENRIFAARAYYNDAVRDYNAKLRRFPGFLVAGLSGLSARSYMEQDVSASTFASFKQ